MGICTGLAVATAGASEVAMTVLKDIPKEVDQEKNST